MKITWISDSPMTNTGYSSQSLFLLNELSKKGYEIDYFAHNYCGQTISKGNVKLDDGTPFNFNLHGHGKEPFCKDVVIPHIRETRPDFVVYLLDTFMIYPWVLDLDFAPARSIFWFPTDGGYFPNGCENVLAKMTHTVAMAKYGQKQVKDTFGINSSYIPHAVDTDLFKPLDDEKKKEIKKKWGLNGRFVVGLVGRNQPRKMHDRALKAFAEFAKDVPDAVLFCHLDPNDAATHFDINKLANSLGIQNRVVYSGTTYTKGFTYKDMNEIYNLFDVYFSSTSGEGFGVCTIEAMSCGIPVVITNYTTSEELVGIHNAGLLVNLVGTEDVRLKGNTIQNYEHQTANGALMGSWGVERGIMDVKDAANKLRLMYDNPDNRIIYGEQGRKAAEKHYSWKVVADQWDKLLKEIKK